MIRGIWMFFIIDKDLRFQMIILILNLEDILIFLKFRMIAFSKKFVYDWVLWTQQIVNIISIHWWLLVVWRTSHLGLQ
jgi:hypothetical protein